MGSPSETGPDHGVDRRLSLSLLDLSFCRFGVLLEDRVVASGTLSATLCVIVGEDNAELFSVVEWGVSFLFRRQFPLPLAV